MSLKNAFRNLESTLKKVLVTPLLEPKSTYTPVSMLGRVEQRIASRLALLAPSTAPSMAFVEASGYVGVDIAFGGFFRRFSVEAVKQAVGLSSRGSGQTPFGVDLYIKVNYPETPTTKVGAETYKVSELRDEDARLIDALMMGDCFSSPTQLAGVGVTKAGSWSDLTLNPTVRVGYYTLEVIEVYP